MIRPRFFVLASAAACLTLTLALPAGAASNPAGDETVADSAQAQVPVPKARPAVVRKRAAAPTQWRRWSAPPVYRPAPPLPRIAVIHWPLILGIGY
jgi:hypothetical protein